MSPARGKHRLMARRVPALADYRLAVRVTLWLCWTTPRLHLMSFSSFLASLSGDRAGLTGAMDRGRAVEIIVRVCRMRLFRLPVFPRICLRQSFALYHFLRLMGYPVQLHVGVRKGEGDDFEAHSWVSYRGQPVADEAPEGAFDTLLSYPAVTGSTEPTE